jgi:hypothetical protein
MIEPITDEYAAEDWLQTDPDEQELKMAIGALLKLRAKN